ncbi:hypothetical protein M0805_009045 [Coniferiporia weirii]|nr:hypothetical protein M0805_009045 [Coniferiporia weirii]
MNFLEQFGFSPFSQEKAQGHYEDLYINQQPRHESSFTHEAIAGAAGFAAMHAYEAHLRKTGQPVTHGKMKEILAMIAAAEVDKLAETKGLDWLDRHKAKKLAEHQAHALAEQRYGEGSSGWEYAQSAAGPAQQYDFGGGAPYGAYGHENHGWYDDQYRGGGGGGYGYGGPPPQPPYGGGPGYGAPGYGGPGGYGEPGYGGGPAYGGNPGYGGGPGYGGPPGYGGGQGYGGGPGYERGYEPGYDRGY